MIRTELVRELAREIVHLATEAAAIELLRKQVKMRFERMMVATTATGETSKDDQRGDGQTSRRELSAAAATVRGGGSQGNDHAGRTDKAFDDDEDKASIISSTAPFSPAISWSAYPSDENDGGEEKKDENKPRTCSEEPDHTPYLVPVMFGGCLHVDWSTARPHG